MQGRLEKELKTNELIGSILSTLPPYVTEWHSRLKASNKTAATRLDYVRKIRKFLEYICSDPLSVTYDLINDSNVTNYYISIQTKLNDDGSVVYTSDSYQQTIWCCLNNFLSFMEKKGYIPQNYIVEIDKPSNKDLDRINEHRRALTLEECEEVIQSIKKSEDRNVDRDVAIFSLFMNTGMRKEALLEINLEDIDVDNRRITVIDKGNKTHVYPINEGTFDNITQWLYTREYILKGKESDALFINPHGERISGTSVYNLINKRVYDALGFHYKPHGCRGSFVSIIYKETGNAELCRRAVGHSNISTTQRYISTDNDERETASQIMSSIFS